MEIELITAEQLERLLIIYNTYPALTYQNKGYDGIHKDGLTTEEQGAWEEVESILRKSISGFRGFQNFRLSKDTKEIQIRFQYNYNYDGDGLPFTGVGYILLDELVNGFRSKD